MRALVMGIVCVLAFATQARGQEGWRLVYRHDAQGRALAGDKALLLDAVRRGYDVRLAWGVGHPREPGRSVEHTALPIFLTIVDQKEVFVQLAEHIAHADYWEPEDQTFGSPQVVWSGILSTTGRFNATWYNRATGAVVRTLPQRVAIAWFAEYPASASGEPAAPLFSSEPPVERVRSEHSMGSGPPEAHLLLRPGAPRLGPGRLH